MASLLIAMLLCLPGLAWAAEVDVTVKWEYQNFPLKIALYEPEEGERNNISKTGTYLISSKPREKVLGKRWAKDGFRLKAGESKPFVLVIKNEGDQDRFFFATPHLVHPEGATLGHHFECLCNHSIFHVPAKSTWYRIVRLQVWPNYQHPRMTLLHTIVGVSQQDANGKFKDRLYRE